MRTICDVCESAPAVLFCAADEAALCRPCDEKVHMCNKLASRHVRVGLADPNKAPRCDICENAPAFFYCEVDGTSLCLQCDMIVHVGGKRTHGIYLLLRQRVEFPGGQFEDVLTQPKEQNGNRRDPYQMTPSARPQEGGVLNHNQNMPTDQAADVHCDGQGNIDLKMIDLNMRPARTLGQPSNAQAQAMDLASDNKQDSPVVVPTCTFERDTNK